MTAFPFCPIASLLDFFGDSPETIVALEVAVSIVEELEIIDVDHHQRQVRPRAMKRSGSPLRGVAASDGPIVKVRIAMVPSSLKSALRGVK